MSTSEAREPRSGVTRRAVLTAGGAAAVGAVIATSRGAGAATQTGSIPFFGKHQGGIVTPAQGHLALGVFTVTTPDRQVLKELLSEWGRAARRLTVGLPLQEIYDGSYPPSDTGEALGLGAANLTLTFGYGPSLFDSRFGLAARRPVALVDLPPFDGDELDPAYTGGDLCVQACADDPQVAFHAIRSLAQLGLGSVELHALQVGSGRTSATTSDQRSARNLLGFKDGTNNLRSGDDALLKRWLWVGERDDQRWMTGGTYLVARRIRMNLSTWSSTPLTVQESVIGRKRDSGAPLTGTREHDKANFQALDPHGFPVIPLGAHIRVAAPETNGGVHLLRRGYNFFDGVDERTGNLNAGLLFICFQRDPVKQFTALQGDLARSDNLSQYITHVGSGVFACPPGIGPNDDLGASLFT